MAGDAIALASAMSAPRRVVCVLVSQSNPSRHYVGVTSDVPTRLAVHNSGGSRHTANDRPWRLVVSLEFASERSALAFEKHLKSGSVRQAALRLTALVGHFPLGSSVAWWKWTFAGRAV
jgi:putative endonuclease